MKRFLIFMMFFVAHGSHASAKLGLGDVSIVSFNQKLELQVMHLFLGAGKRTAYLVFFGCHRTTTTFQISTKDYSTFALPDCRLSGDDELYVDLYYGTPRERKNFVKRYFFEEESKFKLNSAGQIQNYVGAVLRPDRKNRSGFLVIQTVDHNGLESTEKISYSLVYGSTIHYNRWLTDGAYLKKFMLNDTEIELDRD